MDDILNNSIIREDMQRICQERRIVENLRGKRVYISGATGMIASYMVLFLIYLNEIEQISCEIYACARREAKARARFGKYMDKQYFHFIEADVCDEAGPKIRYDYMIHAASLARPQYYGVTPVDVMLPNLIGGVRLLEHAKLYGCDAFVLFSSGSVYGDLGTATVVREDMYGKLNYLAPGNCYGESKRCAEALCKAYHIQYGLKTIITRMFHVYAPTMEIDNDVRVFSEFMGNLVRGEDIVIKSDGTASRAFCYITDAIKAILLSMLFGEAGMCYNISNPHEYMTIAQLAQITAGLRTDRIIRVKTQQREVSAHYQPSPEGKKTIMDISRMERLGWEPKISVKEGFERCYQYLKSCEE